MKNKHSMSTKCTAVSCQLGGNGTYSNHVIPRC